VKNHQLLPAGNESYHNREYGTCRNKEDEEQEDEEDEEDEGEYILVVWLPSGTDIRRSHLLNISSNSTYILFCKRSSSPTKILGLGYSRYVFFIQGHYYGNVLGAVYRGVDILLDSKLWI
jgi:hypothetical protein